MKKHTMRILVINPNTTQSMTETIADAAVRVSNPGTEILAVTSSMGPVSIEGYYDEVFAVPGLLLEIAKAPALGADAAIIACFDDTGLDAARALADIPVIGICEAAVSAIAFIAQRFTIVTTMERSRLPLEHLVHRYGMSSRCNVRAADIPVLSLEEPGSNARERLREEISLALKNDRAEAIVLGCAGMADLTAELRIRRARHRWRRRRRQAGGSAGGNGAFDGQTRRLCHAGPQALSRIAGDIPAGQNGCFLREPWRPSRFGTRRP
jgi:allantoin racemase